MHDDKNAIWFGYKNSLRVFHRDERTHASDFVKDFRRIMRKLKSTLARAPSKRSVFIPKDLLTTEKVFVRDDSVRRLLQLHYLGPYDFIKLFEKTYVINKDAIQNKVSIDRLKPTFSVSHPRLTHIHTHKVANKFYHSSSLKCHFIAKCFLFPPKQFAGRML